MVINYKVGIIMLIKTCFLLVPHLRRLLLPFFNRKWRKMGKLAEITPKRVGVKKAHEVLYILKTETKEAEEFLKINII